jgi:hypothetical protein
MGNGSLREPWIHIYLHNFSLLVHHLRGDTAGEGGKKEVKHHIERRGVDKKY